MKCSSFFILRMGRFTFGLTE
ncbi:hypothetical protein SAMN02910274_02933 [Bacteroides sp. AR29]|nr:hypothetical protein SAMN02910274_02933 [Bacteroides sp. AR29]